jgi:hypothetical protein
MPRTMICHQDHTHHAPHIFHQLAARICPLEASSVSLELKNQQKIKKQLRKACLQRPESFAVLAEITANPTALGN